MKILVINAGSSSLKYQLIDEVTEEVVAKGLCERIGIDGVHTYKAHGEKYVTKNAMPTHLEAINEVLATLVDEKIGVISSYEEISSIGHRVLHGGETFTSSVKVTPETFAKMEELIPLGPLHQPANLMGIKCCEKILPNVPQVAVFDTAFHSSIPAYAYRYAVPQQAYNEWKIRKYGFHGTSHSFIAKRLAEIMGFEGKFIICHVGNGSSVSAVDGGKCKDTSMGYTPLEGLIMGSRSGDVDPSILETIMNKTGKNINQAISYLNKESGLLGLSGVSADMRDVELIAYSDEQSERADNCRLSLKAYEYRVKKYIGSYVAALGGVDAICFTAGVGENGNEFRENVLTGLECLGIKLDKEKNGKLFRRGEENVISADDSKVKIFVIPTNEELMIARETKETLTK